MDSYCISQRPAKAIKCNLHDVSIGEPNAFSEAKTVGAEKMNVNVPRLAVRFVFEMMVFEVGETVRHVRFA